MVPLKDGEHSSVLLTPKLLGKRHPTLLEVNLELMEPKTLCMEVIAPNLQPERLTSGLEEKLAQDLCKQPLF